MERVHIYKGKKKSLKEQDSEKQTLLGGSRQKGSLGLGMEREGTGDVVEHGGRDEGMRVFRQWGEWGFKWGERG